MFFGKGSVWNDKKKIVLALNSKLFGTKKFLKLGKLSRKSYTKNVLLSTALQTLVVTSSDSEPKLPNFVCIGGDEISFEKVCDGTPDCSDSSDETTKLCHHIL